MINQHNERQAMVRRLQPGRTALVSFGIIAVSLWILAIGFGLPIIQISLLSSISMGAVFVLYYLGRTEPSRIERSIFIIAVLVQIVAGVLLLVLWSTRRGGAQVSLF